MGIGERSGHFSWPPGEWPASISLPSALGSQLSFAVPGYVFELDKLPQNRVYAGTISSFLKR